MSIAVVVIVAVGGYLLIANVLYPSTQSASAQKNFFLSLTDPATTPTGTTALYVTYSALQISVSHSGSVSVEALPGSGTVNVFDLQNATIILAATNVPNGSKVTQVKINISNAIITIGGKNSTVVIGEGTITANISSNGSGSGKQNALVDLIPSVTAIETVDKTVYVLTSSVRAVITPTNVFTGQSSNVSVPPSPQVGEEFNFAPNTNVSQIFQSVTPTIKIVSASITVNGNDTDFSMTVRNTGNVSVELNGIMLNGSKNVYFPMPPVSALFFMPAMVFPLPITPPPGIPLPQGVSAPPKFVITFPNGTVMNTTSVFTIPTMPPNASTTTFPIPSQNGSLPPPNATPSSMPPPGSVPGTGSITGTFYILDIVKTAHAISINSSGMVLDVGGDSIAVTTTPPMMQMPPTQTQQGTANGQPSQPQNFTIPAGSTQIQLPSGTTLYMQFPPGAQPPTAAPPVQVTSQAKNMPIGWMIFSNGTLGFPPMSLSQGQAPPAGGSMLPGSEGQSSINSANNAISNIAAGAANVSVKIPNGIKLPPGYDLAAGASVTFTLSGLLTMGPSPQTPSGISMQPPFSVLIPGDTYNVWIMGASGAHAHAKITAG